MGGGTAAPSTDATSGSYSRCLVVNAGANSMSYPLCQGLTSFTTPRNTIEANHPMPLTSILSTNNSVRTFLVADSRNDGLCDDLNQFSLLLG
jgi:hypothetical protein